MDPNDRLLGQIALKMRLVTKEQLNACLSAIRSGEERGDIAATARALGMLTDAELEAIRNQHELIQAERGVPVPAAVAPSDDGGVPDLDVPREAPAPSRPGAGPPIEMVGGGLELDEEPAAVALELDTEDALADASGSRAYEREVDLGGELEGAPANVEIAVADEDIGGATAAVHVPAAALPPRMSGMPPAAPPGTSHSIAPSSRQAAAQRPLSDPALQQQTSDRVPFLLKALKYAAQNRASDLHCHAGSPLMARAHGRLLPFQGTPALPAEATEKVIAQLLSDDQWAILCKEGEVDFALKVRQLGRFRVNAYRQHRGTDIVFRIIPPKPPTLEGLGLPDALAKLVDFRTGLVLCTGPTGCGKSTTLAALLNLVIQSRKDHVITIENPIEFTYGAGAATVTQRQVGAHTESFGRALRAALREDPDVVAITELRDRETISLGLTAAETGHLVLGTLHTSNAPQTIGRIISAFPADEQAQVRTMLAESLRAVVSQRLVPRADGQGRAVAVEVLVVSPAVSNMIKEEKEFQLGSLMQTGKGAGMRTIDDSLAELLKQQIIDKKQAARFAENKDRFR